MWADESPDMMSDYKPAPLPLVMTDDPPIL